MAGLKTIAAQIQMVGLGAAIALSAAVLLGQADDDKDNGVIEAKRLIIRDDDGKRIAEIGETDGGPGLMFYSKDDRPIVRVGVSPDRKHPDFGLFTPGPGGEGSADAIRFGADPFMRGGYICDAKGHPKIYLMVDADGAPNVILFDDKFRPRLECGVTKDGPALRLKSEKGEVIWSAPAVGDS
jgi:hypothetical protein